MMTLALIAALQDPQWIWAPGAPREGQTVHFRARFTVEGPVTGALLHATADNRFELFINGERVASGDDWEAPVSVDVAKRIKSGANVVAVKAVNSDGPGALIVRLTVNKKSVVTNDTWRVSESAGDGWQKPDFDDAAWKGAVAIAPLGGGPWGRAVDEKSFGGPAPAGPAATAPESIKALPGFKVELLYSVPKETQGSWVAMTFDPKGRLIASDQQGKLYRVTPEGMKIEPIALEIGKAHGLLCAFDSLYVMVGEGAAQGNGLYRVRDTDGDDAYDSVELLRKLAGGGEHGPHAILRHPDNRSLVVVAGNHTALPEFTTSLMPRVWAEDHLLPRMWDSNGHAKGIMGPGGWFARVSPDGKEWELMGGGFRNQYDAAYDTEGDLFTFDSDMEWDANTPWYRPTRICHLTAGAEFGWRSGSGVWPTYYADSLPPVVDIGPGSPTGVAFGTGAKFPAKYQEALYACDWSYGKLYAVHLTPSGSSYVGVAEEFLKGSPLPLTDLAVRPQDGALYFTIGGRKTKSALYRVTYGGGESTKPSQPRAVSKERLERRALEASTSIQEAWPHLGSSDRFTRFAARTILERRPPAEWQERALAEKSPAVAMTALLALTRTGDKAIQPRLLEALDRIAWTELDETGKLELLRIYGLAFLRMGSPDVARYVAKFDPLYPSASLPLNAELAQMLIYLQAPSAAAKTIALLEKAPTREEQMNYAFMLRNLTEGWTPALRATYFAWFHKAAYYRGGNSFAGFVRNIKAEAVAKLPPDAVEALRPILEAKPPPEETFSSLAGRTRVKEYTVADLAPAAEKGLQRGRNYDRGRDVFGMVGCFKCHRFAGEGGATGPDLTGAGARFSPRDLLESIVEPSKAISDQYGAIVVKLTNGDVVRGRIVNLGGDNISINTDNADPNAHTGVDRKRIVSIEPSPVSIMPERLIDVLKEDEILDLMAYLISGGDRKHPAFR